MLKSNSEVNRQKRRKLKEADFDFLFTVPGLLPTLNEVIDSCKGNKMAYQRMKENLENLIIWSAVSQRVPYYKEVELEITYYRPDRRHDPDNIVIGKKFILDGLQKAGVLKNDGWKEVKGFKESWFVDKYDPRTEVILKIPKREMEARANA